MNLPDLIKAPIEATLNFFSKKEETKTIYEPDKVKVAQIESQAKLMIAKMEQENIKLDAEAKKDLLETFKTVNIELMKAKESGMTHIVNEVTRLANELMSLSIEKYQQLNNATENAIKTINDYYNELEKDISKEEQMFVLEAAPKMLEQLNKYEKNSDSYNLYYENVKEVQKNHFKRINSKIKDFRKQKSKLFSSNLKSKQLLEQHFNNLNIEISKIIESNMPSLQISEGESKLLLETMQDKRKNNSEIEQNNKTDNDKTINVINEKNDN